jgi:uncharacterized protein YjdB
MSAVFAQLFYRIISGRRYLPYVDITGTTNATINTQTLFPHTLKDHRGNPVAPSAVTITPNSATAPAGQVYEVAANHTTANVDIRATGISVPFRARLWV